MSTRRTFLKSTGLFMGAAIGSPILTKIGDVHGQGTPCKEDVQAILASLKEIAPYGIPQKRVEGSLAGQLATEAIRVRDVEYSALSGSDADREHVRSRNPAISQKVDSRVRAIAEDGLRYTDYKMKTEVEGVWAESNKATVIWNEHVKLKLDGDTDVNAPQETIENFTHLTTLRLIDSHWVVESDDPQFTLSTTSVENVDTTNSGAMRTKQDAPASTDRSARKPEDVLRQEVMNTRATQESSPQTLQTFQCEAWYSRENATAYALAYGDRPNEGSYHDAGNNCMNFVSQCLKTGGWHDQLGFYRDHANWWYSNIWPFGTQTWYNSQAWSDFMYTRPRGNRIFNIWDLWFGDVLQYDWVPTDNVLDHSAIVSYRNYSGVIYMAQHTWNYSFKPLSEIVAGLNSGTGYYPWRLWINYSYYADTCNG